MTFVIIMLIITGIIVVMIARGAKQQAMPTVSVPARIIGRRIEIDGGWGNLPSYTNYYVTFELEDGHRIEFKLGGSTYGLLAEGDVGTLNYKGNHFKSFQRYV